MGDTLCSWVKPGTHEKRSKHILPHGAADLYFSAKNLCVNNYKFQNYAHIHNARVRSDHRIKNAPEEKFSAHAGCCRHPFFRSCVAAHTCCSSHERHHQKGNKTTTNRLRYFIFPLKQMHSFKNDFSKSNLNFMDQNYLQIMSLAIQARCVNFNNVKWRSRRAQDRR
jgi:hypothetical protein